MHFLAAQPTLFPYCDMTRSMVSKYRMEGIITKTDGSGLVPYATDNVTKIYRLPIPECIADEFYVTTFATTHTDNEDWLQEWSCDSHLFKSTTLLTCRTQDFHPKYRPVTVMFCTLFGEKNCNFFRKEWIPFMYGVVENEKSPKLGQPTGQSHLKELEEAYESKARLQTPVLHVCIPLGDRPSKNRLPKFQAELHERSQPIQQLFSIL